MPMRYRSAARRASIEVSNQSFERKAKVFSEKRIRIDRLRISWIQPVRTWRSVKIATWVRGKPREITQRT